jgi:hypothetical protein
VLALVSVVVIGLFHGIVVKTVANVDGMGDAFGGADSEALLVNADSTIPGMWDKLMFSFLMGMFAYVLISAYFLDTHPLYFVFGVIILIPVCMIGMYFNNFFYDVVGSSGDYGLVLTQMPLTDYVMSNFLTYIICMGFATLFILYLKGRRNPSGGGGAF